MDALERTDTFGEATAAALTRDIAKALAHAHAHGVMHRDLKSMNVLITVAWRGKVSDFGLAKKDTSNLFSNKSSNSSKGKGLGTARWKAPEQFGMDKPKFNERSDVYR